MVDITVTATSVLAGSNSNVENGILLAACTAGQVIYKSSTTGTWALADADAVTAEVRQAVGIALNGGSAGQPVRILKSGDVTLNAALTAGIAYYLSNTPGGICPVADIGVGEFVCLIGLAKTTSVLAVNIQYPNVSN